MTNLEKKLRAGWRKLGLDKDEKILVAVSGGADSTALLDALARWKKSEKLFVAHLNHLLRGAESEADEIFVQALAAKLSLPVFVARENIAALAQSEKKNLEATARQARYDFLLRVAKECGAGLIVTGHTHDDQAETLLMRLLRGTGASGLRGIHGVIKLEKNIKLVRPMLEISRAEVLAHCKHYNLNFRHDSFNESMDFTRNRVRRELLPLLATFNPQFGEALVRTMKQSSEDEDYLQVTAQNILTEVAEEMMLNFKPLINFHPSLRRRVLRLWLKQNRGDLRRIGTVHLLALEKLMLSGEGGSYIELPYNWQVRRQKEKLLLQPVRK